MIVGIKNKLAEEIVFFIALALAISTGFFANFRLEAIDWQVIMTLTVLMFITLAFEKYKLLDAIATWALSKAKNQRQMGFLMAGLTALMAMLMTNDVALITVVPITLTISKRAQFDPYKIVVIEALAANMGSALLPFGNPQNLFLYNYFTYDLGHFISVTWPITFLSLLFLALPIWWLPNESFKSFKKASKISNKGKLSPYVFLFVVALVFIVFRWPMQGLVVLTAALLIWQDRKLIYELDYFLLGTFICFFIFVDHVNQFAWLKTWIGPLTSTPDQLMTIAALLSQVISNVPASILLSPFAVTPDPLLIGVSIGGAGTLIASLANLIAYKFYIKEYKARPFKGYFYRVNFSVFIFLILIMYLL